MRYTLALLHMFILLPPLLLLTAAYTAGADAVAAAAADADVASLLSRSNITPKHHLCCIAHKKELGPKL